MSFSTKSQGFTLIELVIVIVLLGILAITAAPKFLDVKADAVGGTVHGMEGALKSGVSLIRSKALISQQLTGEDTLTLKSGTTIAINFGYPEAKFKSAIRYVVELDNIENTASDTGLCETDWCGRGAQTAINTDDNLVLSSGAQAAKVWPRGYSWSQKCGVHYINNRDGSEPIIGSSTSEC